MTFPHEYLIQVPFQYSHGMPKVIFHYVTKDGHLDMPCAMHMLEQVWFDFCDHSFTSHLNWCTFCTPCSCNCPNCLVKCLKIIVKFVYNKHFKWQRTVQKSAYQFITLGTYKEYSQDTCWSQSLYGTYKMQELLVCY